MPIVSVIVPCYNGERWIRRCIASVLKQTIQDIEVIVVNDGSVDDTMSILAELQNLDSRVKVIDKVNGGVSSARNLGLLSAQGEWITFVDVDDEIVVDGIAKMLNLVTDDTEIVFAGYTKNGNIMHRGGDRTILSSNLALAKELFAPTDYPYLGNPWGKLFLRSIIEKHNIRFNESIKYNEDRLFTFKYLSYVKQGIYTTEPVYEYYLHGENAMAAIHGPNYWKFETDLDAFVEMNKIAPAYHSSEIIQLVRMGTIESYQWNLNLNIKYDNNNKATNRRLKKKLLSAMPRGFLFKVYCNQKYINLKIKLYPLAVKIGIK
ncbi:MAG: glycosyltransferase [Muribaculaceae bacterium]|nr:glycosyltransferase [Muribaculaceae bacterium]